MEADPSPWGMEFHCSLQLSRVDRKLGFLEFRIRASSSSYWFRLSSKVQVELGDSLGILDLFVWRFGIYLVSHYDFALL